MGAQLEVRVAHRDGNDGDVRAALCVRLAAEALAEAAILTGAEPRPVGIRVSAGCVRARTWERVIALVFRSLVEHLACQDRREGRQRILAGARRFERVAPRLYLAANVPRFARNRRDVF